MTIFVVFQVRKMIHCFKLLIRLNWRGKHWVTRNWPIDCVYHVHSIESQKKKTNMIHNATCFATRSWLLAVFFLLIKIFYREFGIKNRQSNWQIDTQMKWTHHRNGVHERKKWNSIEFGTHSSTKSRHV